MKPFVTSRKIEVCCDVVLILALLLGGCATAMMWHVLSTPLPAGQHRIDLLDEIDAMAFILNVGLPVAVVALCFSTLIKIRTRTLQLLSLVTAMAGLIGVFACAFAMYGCFVAMTPGVHLWRQIWWRFGL